MDDQVIKLTTETAADNETTVTIPAANPLEQPDTGNEKPATPWNRFRVFIRTVKPRDPLELAQEYLKLDALKGGKERSQDEKELAVITIEHLQHEINERQWGAQIMLGVPHVFTGGFWTEFKDSDMQMLLGEFAEQMGIPPVTARSHEFRNRLRKQFRSRLRCAPSHPDPEVVLINLANGTFEIRNGMEQLRKFRSGDLLTYQLPFAYDPDAKCPMFVRYLERVLPDAQTRMVLAEFFGWVFLRDLKLEKMLLLHGGGSNGKSVTFDVVNALFGQHNISNLSLKSLGKLENRFRLGSALLNFGSEITDECDPDIFKKLVSCEPVDARRLYNDVFEMRHYARLAFNTNVLPRSLEQTEGFFRRLLIIPFEQTISDEEKDVDLAKKIIADELPGVFNWVLDGMRRLRANRKFSPCPASDAALAAYRHESDNVALFLEDAQLQAATDQRISKDELYKDYRDYCKSAGLKPMSKIQFGKSLKNRHRISEGKSGSQRFWMIGRVAG